MKEPGFSGTTLRFNLQQIVSSGVRLRSTRFDAAALTLFLRTLSLFAASILHSFGG
jgi:hypothetical protein